MTLVESSTIKGFEKNKRESENLVSDLIIEFKNGLRYKYEDVPNDLIEEFEKADSKGKFLNRNIKNIYKYERL